MDLSCTICRYQFKTSALLEKHVKNARKKCIVCTKTLCSRISMESHTKHCLSSDTRQCNKCNKKFVDFDTLLWHVEENNCWNPSLNRHCGVCSFYYSNDIAYNDHFSWCGAHSTTGSKCLFCAKYFASSLEMLKHLQFHMPMIMIKCKACPAYFMKEEELTDHMKLHIAPPTLKTPRPSPGEEEKARVTKRVKLEQKEKVIYTPWILDEADEETEDWIIEEVSDEESTSIAVVPPPVVLVEEQVIYESALFFGRTVSRKVSPNPPCNNFLRTIRSQNKA